MKAFMEVFLGLAAYIGLYAAGVLVTVSVIRFFAEAFASPDSTTWEDAYVSESPNAHRYHYSEDCVALRRSSYDIECTSVDEAESDDYTPCKLCLEKSRRYKWDKYVIVFALPVIMGLYYLLNKILDLFKKDK